MSNDDDKQSSPKVDEKQDENGFDKFLEEDCAQPAKQEARAFLRERFLRVITGIIGKPAKFHLYENTTVAAEFRGCDIDFLELYVRKLSTPLGTIPEAVLRTNDVIHFELDHPI
ncbi:gem-associated protein 7-like [Trichogramma pretiosum]|uniref:gem-associated protein 7-like n=1 Tax=Trichogramma pretiosum TaxID=7493 RepID=UPI0006C9DC56|nr:gem-associated protein 7-like [Trichogramma pretiosum]